MLQEIAYGAVASLPIVTIGPPLEFWYLKVTLVIGAPPAVVCGLAVSVTVPRR